MIQRNYFRATLLPMRGVLRGEVVSRELNFFLLQNKYGSVRDRIMRKYNLLSESVTHIFFGAE